MARRKFMLAPLSPRLLVLYIVSVFVVCSDGHSFRNSKGNGAPRELEGLDPGTLQSALVSPFRDPYQQDPYQQGYASKKGQAVCSCSKQQTLLRSRGPGDWNLLGFIEMGGDCKDVKCILDKLKEIKHPCKDVVQKIVGNTGAPDVVNLKTVFKAMTDVNELVENVEKCIDKIDSGLNLDREDKTIVQKYIVKIKESKLYKTAFNVKAAIEQCSFKNTMQDDDVTGFLAELQGCLKALETLSTPTEDTESPGFLNDKIKKMVEGITGINGAIDIVFMCTDIDSLETATHCVNKIEKDFMTVQTELCKYMETSCKKIEKMKVFRLKAVARKEFGKQITSKLLKGLGAVVKLTKTAFSMYEKFTKSQMKFYKEAKCMCDPGAVAYGTPACSGDTVMVQVEGKEVEAPKLETQQECAEKHVTAHLEKLGPEWIKNFADAGFQLLCKSAASATGLGSFAGVVVCDAAVGEANKIVAAFLTPEHEDSDMNVFLKELRTWMPDFVVGNTFEGLIRNKKTMRRDFHQMVCVCAPESDPHSSKRMLKEHKIGGSRVVSTSFGCKGLNEPNKQKLATLYDQLRPNDPPFCEITYDDDGNENTRKEWHDNEDFEEIQKKMEEILSKKTGCWPCRQFKNKNEVVEDMKRNEELLKVKSDDEDALEQPDKADKANIEKEWDCDETIADDDSDMVPKFSKDVIVNPNDPESQQKTQYEECEEHNKKVADHMEDKKITDSANMWDCEKSYEDYGIDPKEGTKLLSTKEFKKNFMSWNSSQRQSYKFIKFFAGQVITEGFKPKAVDTTLLKPILAELGIGGLNDYTEGKKKAGKNMFAYVWKVYCRYRNKHSTKDEDTRNQNTARMRENALNKKLKEEADKAASKEKHTEQDCDKTKTEVDKDGATTRGPKYPKDDAKYSTEFCKDGIHENLVTENKERVEANQPIETYIQENHFERDDTGNYIVASASKDNAAKRSCPGFTSYEYCKNNNLRIKKNKKERKRLEQNIKEQEDESSCITFMDECIVSECARNGALCGRYPKLEDHYRCFLPSEQGDNNYISKKCFDYIKKTKKFKLDKGVCERTSTTTSTCSADDECQSKEGDEKCQGDCVCDESGVNECECHKNLVEFKEKVYGALK